MRVGMVPHMSNPIASVAQEEDCEFEASLGHIVRSQKQTGKNHQS